MDIIGKWNVVDIQNKQPGWHTDITGSIYHFKSDQNLIIIPSDFLSSTLTYKYRTIGMQVSLFDEEGNSVQYECKILEDGSLEFDCGTHTLILKPVN